MASEKIEICLLLACFGLTYTCFHLAAKVRDLKIRLLLSDDEPTNPRWRKPWYLRW